MSRRGIILIIVVVLIAIAIGAFFALRSSSNGGTGETSNGFGNLISNLFGSGGNIPQISPSVTPQENQLGEDGNVRELLSKVTQEPIEGYWVYTTSTVITNADNTTSTLRTSSVYYFTATTDLKHITATGTVESAPSVSYGRPLLISQNAQGNYAAVLFDTTQLAVFDVERNAWISLGSGVQAAAFSPKGNMVVFAVREGNKTALFSRAFGAPASQLTTVARIAADDFSLMWGGENTLFILSKPAYRQVGDIWRMNLNAKTLELVERGDGLSGVFSPVNSSYLLFANKSRKDIAVTLRGEGTTRQPLSFSTLALKCGYSFDVVDAYCAVPQNFTKSSYTLPDDYQKKNLMTSDILYRVGADVTPLRLNKTFDAHHLIHVNNALYFINAIDQHVYKLETGNGDSYEG